MNGAESLVKTLLASGVSTCFANPGTSEMHFVAALDRHPEMRCVLCLFEGGTTGAADGFARMHGDVAATLLHLAPGFGNGFANLHNARKAGSGVVNIVGDHAIRHMAYESPLKGDVPAISNAVSHWTRVCPDAGSVAADGAAAITAARAQGGQIATLILPADTAWGDGGAVAPADAPAALARSDEARITAAAVALRQPGAVLMIGGSVLYGPGRVLAGQIATATGARLMADTSVARIARGAGTTELAQLPYPVEPKVAALASARHIVLCGLLRPVTFFAYPGKPSLPEPEGCVVTSLSEPGMDTGYALQALADALGVGEAAPARRVALDVPALPDGALTLDKVGTAIAALLPEEAIVVNESVTAGVALLSPLAAARPHDLIGTTGGAIGQCLPAATGAAVACPGRKVLALTGDGSAMYTLQSLWTMAREALDVTVIVISNRGYQILHGELANMGVNAPGHNAARLFDLVDPALDWVALAKGHGVPGKRATDMESFNAALAEGLAAEGPYLIEVMAPEPIV